MNDRFKFRLYDKKIKEMIYADNKTQNNINIINYLIYCNNSFIDWDIENYALMQCTGLKDKNGNLIYEGDVINIWCKNLTKNQISEVKFCKEKAAFTFDYITDFNNIVPCTMEKTIIEVIGNIYENKELLNEI